MWAFDAVDALRDSVGSTNQKAFVVTPTEYFTKWAEVKEIKAITLVKFIAKNIITRFGVPKTIVTDNGIIFVSAELKKIM